MQQLREDYIFMSVEEQLAGEIQRGEGGAGRLFMEGIESWGRGIEQGTRGDANRALRRARV